MIPTIKVGPPSSIAVGRTTSHIPPGYELPAESNAGEAQTQDSFAPEYNSDS